MADTAFVRFVGIDKTYDGVHRVVRDLNLDIRRGEFLSLLGPSGSGKTTTLMMLAGFESPTGGEILLDGAPITRVPPHRREFGMVFQNYALFPHMKVRENVAYPLTVRKLSRSDIDLKVQRALDMVQLTGLGERRPSQLSGGQQQRVALARALVFEPKLVLMDEPLGALDKQLREHMQVELKALHRQLGVTFVYVTHDQDEALAMSDRVAVFNDGVVQQVDTVDRLYETPVNRFVASFVGDATVLEGAAGAFQGDHRVLRLPDGSLLHGIDVNCVDDGAALRAVIRPERLGLRTDPPSQPAANTLVARVEDLLYFGDHVRARCALAGQSTASVRLSLGAAPLPHAGQTVWLHFPAAHLRLYA